MEKKRAKGTKTFQSKTEQNVKERKMGRGGLKRKKLSEGNTPW